MRGLQAVATTAYDAVCVERACGAERVERRRAGAVEQGTDTQSACALDAKRVGGDVAAALLLCPVYACGFLGWDNAFIHRLHV